MAVVASTDMPSGSKVISEDHQGSISWSAIIPSYSTNILRRHHASSNVPGHYLRGPRPATCNSCRRTIVR